MNLYLVDYAATSPTAQILQTALQRSAVGGAGIEVMSPDRIRRASLPLKSTVFVLVSEPALSVRPPGAPWVSCGSVSLACALAQFHRVHLLRRAEQSPLSGIDCVTYLMAGVAGVADDKALLHNGAVEAFLNHVSQRNREVAMQIAGRSVAELNKVVTLLEDWETRLDGDPTYDPACWRAAWAMAQLEHLRPMQGPGDRYSFEKLANTLNMQQAMTGFQLSPSDLRKVIAILNRYWCGDSDERADRGRMPEFARQAGFPRIPPTIPGLNANDAPKRLYDSCRTLRMTNDLQAHEDAPRCVAHLQLKHSVVEKTHGKNN